MNNKRFKFINLSLAFIFLLIFSVFSFGQNPYGEKNENEVKKAETVLKKAIEKLGGDAYLNVKTQIGRGKYSLLREGRLASFQTFVDVIVYFDKERTEFKFGGVKNIQTNNGDSGWIYDSGAAVIKDQDENQIENFKQGMRTSLEYLLRGGWKKEDATLEYGGRRSSTLGKRNDVVKLIYKDGFIVEYEFDDDGLPMKSFYTRIGGDGEKIREENRYAQFVTIQGILTPFIIDHYTGETHISRINYEEVEYNKTVSDSIFSKPDSPKSAKKDLKL